MRTVTTLALLFAAAISVAQQDADSRAMNQPVAPFRIAGNLYYIGASDVTSYLVVTPKGLIVIDGGFVETAPMIRANIAKLGFRLADVRILLNTHAHCDHAGGIAALKEQTDAAFLASDGDAPLLERGGKDDPQFGNRFSFPPIKPDRLLRNGDRVKLGGSTLTAVITPGHTPGCTTWTMTLTEQGKPLHVVIVGSPSFPGYKFNNNIINDYRTTFARLESLRCDIFLVSHGSFFHLRDKMARIGKGPNPFVDPAGYRQFVASWHRQFEEEVRGQQAAR
jgi:metallo-beta-lactamase class B